MRRLSYNPKVKAYINITNKDNPDYGKTIDVSDDIINGSINLQLNQVSRASLRLQNKNGKYLGGYNNSKNESTRGFIFTPMDRIIIAAGRITDPFQIFTGYLDEVPAFQLYPDAVDIKASSSLKVLYNTYFDPGLPYMIQYFAEQGYAYDPQTGLLSDPKSRLGNWGIYGGIGDLMKKALTDIAQWPEDQIHFVAFPETFTKAIEEATGNFGTSNNMSPQGSGGAAGAFSNPVTAATSLTNQIQKATAVDVIKFMVDHKYTAEDGAAFAGNFNQESHLVPGINQNGGGPGFGLAQWEFGGSGGSGRADSLLAFAGGNRDLAATFNVQMNFVLYELKTNQSNTDRYLKDITGTGLDVVKRKAKVILDHYEVPAVVVHKDSNPDAYNLELAQRQADAVAAYEAWGVTGGIASPTPELVKPRDIGSANSVIAIAEKELNTSESPSGSDSLGRPLYDNYGPAIQKYQNSTDPPAGSHGAWCAAFVSWVFQQAHIPNAPKSPNAARQWFDLGPSNQLLNNSSSWEQILPGDLVFFSKAGTAKDIDHVGIVYRNKHKGIIDIIEGNAGPDATKEYAKTDNITVDLYENLDLVSNRRHVYGFGRVLDQGSPLRGNPTAGGLAGVAATTTAGGSTPIGSPQVGNTDMANGFVSQNLATAANSYLYTGDHALANDISFMEWIKDLNTASGRVFCSAPNGDFYSFFPDYFGWFDTTPYFYVSDIEIKELNVQLTDSDLVTHVYGVGPLIGYTDISLIDYAASAVASIQSPAFNSFIKTNNDINAAPTGSLSPQDILNDFVSKDWDENAMKNFLNRYGARPLQKELTNIRNPALLWMATWMEFMKNWAKRYQATSVKFTFMPELFPGGRVNIAGKLEMFIESVSHNFSYDSGFHTDATLSSPTAIGANLEGEAQRAISSSDQVSNNADNTSNKSG